MSRQRTVNDTELWRSVRLANCTMEDRSLNVYLLTSPFSNIVGVYPIVARVAASEIGWDLGTQFTNVLRRLVDSSLADFDECTGMVWVKTWWDHHSATMAVASTLRGRTFREISDIPERWLVGFGLDLLARLPTDSKAGNLHALVGDFLASLPGWGSVLIPDRYPIDRGRANTNSIPINTTTTTAELKDSLPDLRWPASIAISDRAPLLHLLSGLDRTLSQQLLSELGEKVANGKVTEGPVQYMHGLVKAARSGLFVPKVAREGLPGKGSRAIVKDPRSRAAGLVTRSDPPVRSSVVKSEIDKIAQYLRLSPAERETT